ncbi:MAG: mechanosensitive ion channel [Bacteroidales bacterium]|jgi:small conductance mechanosensitive channel|nr:mechanosensitive ion channel [Bacteroidales bacterium]
MTKLPLLSSLDWIKVAENYLPMITSVVVKIIVAVLIILIGLKLIKFLTKTIAKAFEKRHLDISLRPFILSLVSIGLKILLFLSVIGYLGIETSAFVGLLASIGIAIGMAFSGTLQNIAGGVVLLILRPFKVGDFITASGFDGTVTKIMIFNTYLLTTDNKEIIIPNGTLATGNIINYSTMDTRRIDINLKLAHGVNIAELSPKLIAICKADKRIFADPEPITIGTITDLSITLDIRFWVSNNDYWDVMQSINESIYAYLVANNVELPYTKVDLNKQ